MATWTLHSYLFSGLGSRVFRETQQLSRQPWPSLLGSYQGLGFRVILPEQGFICFRPVNSAAKVSLGIGWFAGA